MVIPTVIGMIVIVTATGIFYLFWFGYCNANKFILLAAVAVAVEEEDDNVVATIINAVVVVTFIDKGNGKDKTDSLLGRRLTATTIIFITFLSLFCPLTGYH